jgi:hypothetical protein
MKNLITDYLPKTITVAELCEALANGAIQAKVEDDMYIVRNGDLMRLARTRELRVPALAAIGPRSRLVQAS